MLDHGLDQAAGLRRMMAPPPLNVMAFPLSGTGPQRWIARVAHSLRALGRRPLVVDAARGAVSASFGLNLRHDLIDMLQGRRDFDEVAQATSDGVHVLRADLGIEAFVGSGASASQLFAGFARLSHGFDDLLLAMPASEIACLAGPATCVPVVSIFPVADGMVKAYRLVKELAEDFGYRRFACVVRQSADAAHSQTDHARFAAACNRFLGVDIELAGCIEGDGTARTLACVAQGLVDATAKPLTLH
ncbi:MAG: hypothetical protein H7255_08640 [Ramlibacter sp.]|nr:hypothetical protein [Ramlibacter sp.]